MTATALSASRLIKAFEAVFNEPSFPEKLIWWLRFGFPAEHWLQFELGFWLNKLLGTEYAVWYEKGKVDLVILKSQPIPVPAEKYTPLLNLELKVHGNWYSTPEVFSNIKSDMAKNPHVPSASLVLWFLARPRAGGHHDWINNQIDKYEPKNKSLRTLEKIEERMNSECNGAYKLLHLPPVRNLENTFETMDAYLFYYRNELAQSEGLLE